MSRKEIKDVFINEYGEVIFPRTSRHSKEDVLVQLDTYQLYHDCYLSIDEDHDIYIAKVSKKLKNVNIDFDHRKRVDISKFLDKSLHSDLVKELLEIEKMKDLSSKCSFQNKSLQETLDELLETKRKIEEETPYHLHNFYSYVEDNEYERQGMTLTLNTPVLTTCFLIGELLTAVSDIHQRINHINESIEFFKDKLEKKEIELATCKDEEYKKSVLKPFVDEFQKAQENKRKEESKYYLSKDVLVLLDPSIGFEGTFYEKHNLVHIVEKFKYRT